MKKLLTALCALAMLSTMAGCQDATAGISNGGDTLVSINGTKITKDEMYTSLKSSSGSNITMTLIEEKIAEKEGIKVDDALKKEAQTEVDKLKKDMGGEEAFKKALKDASFKDENDYKERVTYPTLKRKNLKKKYIADNEDKIYDKYHPMKAMIIETNDQKKADSALAELKKGTKMDKVYKTYGNEEGKYTGKETIYHSDSGLPSSVWSSMTAANAKGVIKNVIKDTSEENKFYVVEITNLDPKSIKDEISNELVENANTLNTTMMESYLKKYKFNIYDIDIYNQIKKNNPSYLNED